MAITFVDSAVDTDFKNSASGDSTVSVAVSSLTGLQDDDLLVAFAYGGRGGNGGVPPWNATGSGFTSHGGITTISSLDRRVDSYYKVASSESGSYTWTLDSDGSNSHWTVLVVAAFRGCDTTTPIDVSFDSAQTAAHILNTLNSPNPDITTVTDGAWVLLADSHSGNATMDITAYGAPSGYTLRASTGISQNRVLALATNEIASAGAENPGNWTHSGTASGDDLSQITMAIRPSSGAVAGALPLVNGGLVG